MEDMMDYSADDFIETVECTNETIHMDTWIVIYENQTAMRELSYTPNRYFIVALGVLLSVAGILLNTGILTVLWKKHKSTPEDNSSGSRGRPWIVLSICVAELMTSSVVVPLRVIKEYYPKWPLGLAVCRVWLFLQVYLVSVVTWLLLAETLDRLISAANGRRARDNGDVILEEAGANEKALSQPPHARGQPKGGARRRHVMLCLAAWLVPLLIMTSVNATTDDDSEYLIADYCVVTVTPTYALSAAVGSFFGPASLLLLLTALLGLVTACAAPTAAAYSRSFYQAASDWSKPGTPLTFAASGDTTSAASYDVGDLSPASAHRRGHRPLWQRVLGLPAVSLAHLALWCPLFASTVAVSFCDVLCVEPAMWLFFAWLGHSSASALPALLLLDGCRSPGHASTTSSSTSSLAGIAVWRRLHSIDARLSQSDIDNKRYNY